MTLLKINLMDVLSETDPDDRVIVWSPILREGPAGGVVNTRQRDIPLVNGVGEDEVVPGPLIVQIQRKGIGDSRPREVVIPDRPEVTLLEVMESTFAYTPPVVGVVSRYRSDTLAAQQAAEDARDTAVEAAGTVAGVEATITEARDQAVQAVHDTAEQLAHKAPRIEGGTWWIGDEDTGVPAQGPPGSGGGGGGLVPDPDHDGLYLIGA